MRKRVFAEREFITLSANVHLYRSLANLGGFLSPRAENCAHQAQPDERIEFIDCEEFLWPHLVHVGCVRNRTEKADPHQQPKRSASRGGAAIAPSAELREHRCHY